MPYVDQRLRATVAPELDALIQRLRAELDADPDGYEGLLNYTITSLCLGTIPGRRYRYIARTTGVLENVKQEFYRRYAAPYEDEQIEKSGDVFE